MRTAKRRQDLRRIRPSQCYTIAEVARLLGVSVGTVRAWLMLGLPALEGEGPTLIPGDALKSWLIAQRQSRKRQCQPDELFCCRCRLPRKAKPDSVEIVPRNAKTIAISALCATCNAKMNKGGSLANLHELRTAFSLESLPQVNLAGCENPAVIQHLEWKETE